MRGRIRKALIGTALIAGLALLALRLTQPAAPDDPLTACQREYQPALCQCTAELLGDTPPTPDAWSDAFTACLASMP